MNTELRDDIGKLLLDTGRAHHAAFAETDGVDPEWPIWYAEYLQVKLGNLLDTQFTRSELIYLLVMADREQAQSTGGDWLMFYADFFIDRYA